MTAWKCTPRPRRVATLATAAAATLALAGCGAGQVGTIGSQVAAVNGSQGSAGELDVRDATIAYPLTCERGYVPGDDAPLLFTITNNAVTTDELASITTPAAEEVALEGALAVSGSRSLVSAPQEEAASGTTTATASATATDLAEPDTTPSSGDVPGVVTAELTGITQDLRPGLTVPVTFTFASGSTVTLPVPIGSPSAECNEVDAEANEAGLDEAEE